MLRRLAAAVLCTAAAIVSVARAESVDADTVTAGALTERADAVVVAEVVGTPERADAAETWTFRVTDSIRGGEAGASLRVTVPSGRAPVAAGGRFLAFLRRTGSGWEPLELPWSVRATAEPVVPALADHVRAYARCLDGSGRVSDPAALAKLLVDGIGSSVSGLPSSAGRDLVRHEELAPHVTAQMRAGILAALASSRRPDNDRAAIVSAAGVYPGDGADGALVSVLRDPESRNLRRHVTGALRRIATPRVVALLAESIEKADAALRADLANALGRLDLREAEAPLLRLLADDDASVRFEAAHGLGLLARAVRAPRAGEDPAAERPKLSTALAPLVTALGRATDDAAKRAALWAIAQIDVQDAWAELRRQSESAADLRVREIAKQVLARPRTALLPE